MLYKLLIFKMIKLAREVVNFREQLSEQKKILWNRNET
jgi:hypothetical protein